ncbi:MAG TPA: AAA family ATPase, partial [Chitinophagaceae bacterium]
MKEPVYFLKLELENVRSFGKNATLDLSDGNDHWKKWTVILGDNGTGKTTLLQAILGFKPQKISLTPNRPGEIENPYVSFLTLRTDIEISFNVFIKESSEKSILVRISSTFVLKNGDKVAWGYGQSKSGSNISRSKIIDGKLAGNLFILGYGANRLMSTNSITESKTENPETLFNDEAKLINAEEWLLQLDYAASKDSDIKSFAETKRNQVKQILIDLLPDVEEIRFSTPTKENLKSSVEFKTPFGWVTIHQLSLGYKTMVVWMVDLAARMFERYPDSDNPLAEPAIVLVDEIDLHLHPKWQRKIFDYLSDKFPQAQFIVTAHSPLVVQSAPKDANIVVLRKDDDRVVIDNDIKSVQ